MRSSFARIMAAFDGTADQDQVTQPLLESVLIEKESQPVKPSLRDEEIAVLDLLSKNQARQLARVYVMYLQKTLAMLGVIALALVAPISMIFVFQEMCERLYKSLLPGRQKELAESITRADGLRKIAASNDEIRSKVVLLQTQARERYSTEMQHIDQAWWAPDTKYQFCSSDYHASVEKDNCFCWHEADGRIRGFSEFGSDQHPGWDESCWFANHQVQHPIVKCQQLLDQACNQTEVYSFMKMAYNTLFDQLIPYDKQALDLEMRNQIQLKGRIAGVIHTVEPISATIMAIVSAAALVAIISYAKHYYHSYQEYKSDQIKIRDRTKKIDEHFVDHQDAIRFINLAERLEIKIKDTTLGQWILFLQEHADYLLTKKSQKTFFQSPFFRQLPPELRENVVGFIPISIAPVFGSS